LVAALIRMVNYLATKFLLAFDINYLSPTVFLMILLKSMEFAIKFRLLSRSIWMFIILCATSLTSCKNIDSTHTGAYVSGDFHQHTTYSGGDYSIGHVMEAANKYGLDWWSNSDHGGTREFWGKASGDDLGTRVTRKCAGVKLLGDPGEDGYMLRWQSLKYYNFQDILIWRRVFPDKLILQAFEWNVPGHQYANVSIIANQFDKGKRIVIHWPSLNTCSTTTIWTLTGVWNLAG
jgi:hypothetical protein